MPARLYIDVSFQWQHFCTPRISIKRKLFEGTSVHFLLSNTFVSGKKPKHSYGNNIKKMVLNVRMKQSFAFFIQRTNYLCIL